MYDTCEWSKHHRLSEKILNSLLCRSDLLHETRANKSKCLLCSDLQYAWQVFGEIWKRCTQPNNPIHLGSFIWIHTKSNYYCTSFPGISIYLSECNRANLWSVCQHTYSIAQMQYQSDCFSLMQRFTSGKDCLQLNIASALLKITISRWFNPTTHCSSNFPAKHENRIKQDSSDLAPETVISYWADVLSSEKCETVKCLDL